jgi:dipeptidyl aminopeptidase/acylaminoacyl peptidase
MKKVLLYISIPVIFILIGWFANTAYHLPKSSNPISQIKPTPLLKYSIENLSSTTFVPSQITIGEVIKDNPKYISYKFDMKFSPDFSTNLKSTSGLINIPKGEGTFPVIIMYRGYVDQKTYITGSGTQPSASVFASNGFITVAPDFLGYGQSDTEAADIFETRFQTYVTAVTILKSVGSIKQWDGKNIFIWGHSNGGQIALTTLEITGDPYPTVLWAPVSRPFPASILYYIDESEDGGRLIIDKLAEFNETYDASKFSLSSYLDRIKAPIEIHQGTIDTAVPYWWSDSIVKTLKATDTDVAYLKYSGANHNLVPLWDRAVENSLTFYKSHFIK